MVTSIIYEFVYIPVYMSTCEMYINSDITKTEGAFTQVDEYKQFILFLNSLIQY